MILSVEPSPKTYGALSILPTGDVQIHCAIVELRPIVKATLLALLENPGDLVTRKAIADRTECRGYGTRTSRCVDISISRLRASLGTEGWRIQNIYGKGYRFDPRQQKDSRYE